MGKITDFLFAGTRSDGQRKALRWFWLAVLAIPVGIFLFFFGLSFTDLPSVTELENPKNNEATRVIAGDGTTVLGRLFVENRVMVDYSELGQPLEDALISTEDERYYDHSGIDWKSLGRVVVKTAILGQESSGGGSTISQQLAKLLFTGPPAANIVERALEKFKEWIIAVRLERKYTKQEIMAMYLNRYDFINGAQGIRAASENYFGGKKPDELTINEAATLVGMLKNASLYNPLKNPEGTMNRRNQVLAQMVRNDRLPQSAYDTLKTQPLGINYTRQMHDDGLAPYFRMVLAEDVKKILSQKEYYKAGGEKYDIYRDGLTFYTTIDPYMQRIAEVESVKHMAKLQKEFFSHWKNEDPWTFTDARSESEVRVVTRQAALTKDIRQSARYQGLRAVYLTAPIGAIGKKHDLTFHNDDREIDRMVRESNGENVITDLVRDRLISKELAAGYRQVMKLDAFAELKTAWEKLQARVEKEFNEPVDNMRVFTYGNSPDGDGYDHDARWTASATTT